MRVKLFVVMLFLVVLSTAFLPARAAFTNPPTLDATTTSNCAGATNAIYMIHGENPADSTETIAAEKVVVPAGYSINPTYLTTTPGILIMTGVGGNIGGPPAVYIEVRTTTTSGTFEIFVNSVSFGTGTVVPPTPTTWGNIGTIFRVGLHYLAPGQYFDGTFVAGVFINPSTPGLYVWGPNTATPTSGPDVPMNPRPGETMTVDIVTCAVGGFVMPVNKLAIAAPYLILFGLVATVAVVVAAPWKKRED